MVRNDTVYIFYYAPPFQSKQAYCYNIYHSWHPICVFAYTVPLSTCCPMGMSTDYVLSQASDLSLLLLFVAFLPCILQSNLITKQICQF